MSAKNKGKGLSQRILGVKDDLYQIKIDYKVLRNQRIELIEKLKKGFKIKPAGIEDLIKKLDKEIIILKKEIEEKLEQVEDEVKNIGDK